MFSISNIRNKVNKSKVSYSFSKFMFGDVCSIFDIFLLLTATAIFSLSGGLIGLGLVTYILPTYTGFTMLGCMTLSALSIWGVIYRSYKKSYKKEKYNVSQEDLREYIRSLENTELKKNAINCIAETAKENKGNISFKEFESIYNKIKEIKRIEILEKEDEAAKEATECLMKTLEKEVYDEKELIIEHKQEQNVI